MRYQVTRHSGRSNTEFRTILDTDNEEKARALYEDRGIRQRQGSIRLVIDGTIVGHTVAPRLRSRW